jgi:hypothetical protein
MKHFPPFESAVRALVFLVALIIAGYLAIASHSQQAEGAVLLLLGTASSFMFRGRVEKQATPSPSHTD